jgi:preprotein translocase subunit SecB
LVLLPFLREAVYSFTQKTGFRPVLIPLIIEAAAFRVTPPPVPVGPPEAIAKR